jgi:hypothetical protein
VAGVRRALALSFWIILSLVLLGGGARGGRDPSDRLQRFTAPVEFDFAGWTVDALGLKLGQDTLGEVAYLSPPDRTALVRRYLGLVRQAEDLRNEIEKTYADPAEKDPRAASSVQRASLADLRRQIAQLQPAAEAILQEQAAVILADSGLASLGAPFPSVAFHMSPLPMALIVSPRNVIRQDALITLLPDLTIEQQVALEKAVESHLDVSALVEPVGGIGTYPTMVEETTDLGWLTEVVLHEWTHNYLTLRPLGLSYDASPETRTMNETTASLIGKALGRALLERYYPDLVPPAPSETPPSPSAPPSFDFNAEMHATRVDVDRLLAEGKVDEAEAYMEQRRQRLVEHGYVIRRLNQAYFAFHGAYADTAQGAAGADPVGEAVRRLWARSASPAAFLRTIAWMSSFADLQRYLARSGGAVPGAPEAVTSLASVLGSWRGYRTDDGGDQPAVIKPASSAARSGSESISTNS